MGGREDQRGPCIWARGKKPHSPEKNAGWPGQTTCPQEFPTFRTEHSPPAVLRALGLRARVLPWRLWQISLEEREGPRVCQDRALGLEHPAGWAALVHPGLDGMGAAATCAERCGSGRQGLWSSPGGLGCSSGVKGPGLSGLGHLVGPPATGPSPCPGSGAVSLWSAQGSCMVHPPPVAGMGPPGPGLCPWWGEGPG